MGNITNDEALEAGIPDFLLHQLKGSTYADDGLNKSGDKGAGSTRTLKKSGNAWNYRSQRQRLSHLIDQPPSKNEQVGTRDISFLYEKNSDKPLLAIKHGDSDSDAALIEQKDTMLPSEFQIIRSERVAGLSVKPSQYATHLTDNNTEAALRVFPSLHPNRRYEAKQLEQTFDKMVEDLKISEPVIGPSQMHNLIELVKKEQNIYDTIFYEVIRQVTIECKERGQLLSKLRKRYADLIAKIPRQINSLHGEVIAQRALDRKLTSELLQFKQSMKALTKELSSVKKQDAVIAKDAEKSKEELKIALADAAKNSAILQEYHQLYELQRQRLEKQIKSVSFERDIWNSTAYSLALKLIEENELTISRRLYVSERAWSRMAGHFTVLISDKDSAQLTALQDLVQKWRATILEYKKTAANNNEQTRNKISDIQAVYQRWTDHINENYVYVDFTESKRVKIPTQKCVDEMCESFSQLKTMLAEILAYFGSSESLALQDKIMKMNELTQNLTDTAIDVYSRHRSLTGEKFAQHEVMTGVYDQILKLHNQLQLQSTGENGVTSGLLQMTNDIAVWHVRFEKCPAEEITENEWLSFLDKLVEWMRNGDLLKNYLGSIAGLLTDEKDIQIEDTIKVVSTWLHETVTGIESENMKINAMLTSLQNDMLKWMSASLVLLVPDKSNNLVLRKIAIPSELSVNELVSQQEALAQRCSDLAEYISKCAHSIVTSQNQTGSTEFPLLDQLKSFQSESSEWEKASSFICECIQGSYEEDYERQNKTEAVVASKPGEETEEQLKERMTANAQNSLPPAGPLELEQVPLENPEDVPGEQVYLLGGNEVITSRPISRPSSGTLAQPLTAHSAQALKALDTVSQLQSELLTTEERAQNAELKIEELEDHIRELEKKIIRQDILPPTTPDQPVVPVTPKASNLTVSAPSPALSTDGSSTPTSKQEKRAKSSRKNKRK